jgi:thioredoxin 1
MTNASNYLPEQVERSAIDSAHGWLLLDFGTDGCGHCQAARQATREVLSAASGLVHLRVEDGPGRALGRSFKVKLWPTWVLLKDGQEVARLVRPTQAQQASDFLAICKASAGGL